MLKYFQPGDQLLSVNGQSFHGIQHGNAVNILAQSPSHNEANITVTYKRVGMIPYSPVPIKHVRSEKLSSPKVPYSSPLKNEAHLDTRHPVSSEPSIGDRHSFSGSAGSVSVANHRETVSPALEEIMMVKEKVNYGQGSGLINNCICRPEPC